MSPSPNALWLVAGHLESSNPVEQLHELRDALGHGKLGTAGLVEFPQFKVSPTSRRRIVIHLDVNRVEPVGVPFPSLLRSDAY